MMWAHAHTDTHRATHSRVQLHGKFLEFSQHGSQIDVWLGEVEKDAQDSLSGTGIVDHLQKIVTLKQTVSLIRLCVILKLVVGIIKK